MKKLLRIFLVGLSLLSTLFLSGCSKLVVLNPQGPVAADEKRLLIDAVLLMLIVIIPVMILAIVIPIKYRASNHKAKYTPNWSHNSLLELIWWFIPLMIILVLGTLTWRTTHALNPYSPLSKKSLVGVTAKPMTIQVVALRWKWLFIYPKQGIATVNYVKFPVKTPVKFEITADAPMNSFQIPALGGQIYAMNGMRTMVHYLADHKGTYWGRSVSYSGNGFAGMKFNVYVPSTKDFKEWVAKVKASHKTLSWQKYEKLVQPSSNNKVEFFSSVTPDLFHRVIQKFLSPKAHLVNKKLAGVQL